MLYIDLFNKWKRIFKKIASSAFKLYLLILWTAVYHLYANNLIMSLVLSQRLYFPLRSSLRFLDLLFVGSAIVNVLYLKSDLSIFKYNNV